MNIVFKRAVTAFNMLALLLAFAAVSIHARVTSSPFDLSLLEYWISVLLATFLYSLPFSLTLSILYKGWGEKLCYFVMVLNLLVCVGGGLGLYLLLHRDTVDAIVILSIGLAPVALGNAVYLMFDTSAA